MSEEFELDRRTFIKGAGATALAGALGSATIAEAASKGRDMGKTKYNFDEVYNRVGWDNVKWDLQRDKFGTSNIEVGMGIADMDFKAAPCVAEALAERCKHENWGYQSIALGTYIDAIVDWNKTRHGVDVDPDSVVLAEGVHPGLVATLKTVSPPASKVLLMTPTYNGFYSDLRNTQTIPNESVMTLKNGRYDVDWEDLEARMTPDTHAMLLCNPQNPTGNVWSKKDLMRIGKLCLENDVLVLADEIHCDFVRRGVKYTPFASLRNKDVVNNSVSFKAVSKTFSLAAMKSAYFFSTNSILLERIKKNHHGSQNTLGMVANEAALRDGRDWFDQLLPYIHDNHSFVENYVKENLPMVGYTKAQGTFLSWLDMTQVIQAIGAEKTAAITQMTDDPKTATQVLEQWLVTNAKVQLNAGSTYGKGAENHMRMNIGTSRKMIKHALDNIAAALRNV